MSVQASISTTARRPRREASASPHAAATLKLKALFAHLQLSQGAVQLRSREPANGPGSPLAA